MKDLPNYLSELLALEPRLSGKLTSPAVSPNMRESLDGADCMLSLLRDG